MSIWVTSDVVAAVSVIPEVKISGVTLGEDYTTKSLYITVDGSQERVFVRGFVTNGKALRSDDNVDIEMVEVATGYSDGDMPNDPDYVIAHAKVQAAIMKLGHRVVKSMDGYF
jgi:hypothetical protein